MWPYDPHLAAPVCSSSPPPGSSDFHRFVSQFDLSPLPRFPLHYCCSTHVLPPYKKGLLVLPDQYREWLKPFAPLLGTRFPVLRLRRLQPVSRGRVLFRCAMVIAGGPELSPVRAVVASVVIEKSQAVSASATAAMKPPLPPAPKPASSAPAVPVLPNPAPPAADSPPAAAATQSGPAAPVVAPHALPRQEPEHVASAAVVVPPAAAVPAAPAALGTDLALAAVSATTGGLAPAVESVGAVQSAPAAPLGPSVYSSLGLLALAMVIAGADEPSPELAASWSAVVVKPPSEPKGATTAMKPPLPPAPKPASAVSEMPPPLAPDAPVAVTALVQSVPVASPSPPAAAPAPPADSVVPSVPAPAGAVADPPVPLPGAPAAPSVSAPADLASASALPPKAASATTADPALLVSPAVALAGAPAAPAVQPSRPPSPDCRLSRPHSPAPQQERRSSRRRRDSPRRYQQQAHSPAHPGAVEAPRPAALPLSPSPVAAPPPPILVPPAPAPAASAPPSGSRLHLPPVPPVAGVEFVAVGGGSSAQYSHHDAADGPLLFLTEALQPPQTRVPEATLGQLHRLAESLHVLLLIQVLAHSSLPVIPAETFRGRQRDTCLDAADQLASLLAPVLAAPAEGGAAAVGQLDEAVRGLRRHLRAGSGAAAIGASTLVVRELWRSLTGVLHALGAHRM
ncbi:unnamed protein product [Closterium sp. Naga37s-1]|nr:unnamed protein product [Closterium sp. Naga37s-1]